MIKYVDGGEAEMRLEHFHRLSWIYLMWFPVLFAITGNTPYPTEGPKFCANI